MTVAPRPRPGARGIGLPVGPVAFVLLLAVLAQAGWAWWLHQRQQRLAQVVVDLTVFTELDISREHRLMLLADPELADTPGQLRVLHAGARTWLGAFCDEHALEPSVRRMLEAELGRHLGAWGDAWLEAELAASPAADRAQACARIQEQHLGVVSALLGETLGGAYRVEIEARWSGWWPG